MRTARISRRSKTRSKLHMFGPELCQSLEQRLMMTMTFKLTYDATVTALPNFNTITSAVNNAVTQLKAAFTNTITINITVKAGTIANGAAGTIGNGTATLANAVPTYQTLSYAALTNALRLHHTTAERASAVLNLPASDPTSGGTFSLASAEAKALGIKTTAKTDGTFTFNATGAYTFNASQRATAGKTDFIGMVIDGFTKIMGRAVAQGSGTTPTYHPADLFRFTAAGVHSYSTDMSYFSVDGGTTNLNPYSDNNDAVDWATDPMTPVPDAFNDDVSVNRKNDLTEADREFMDVLGYIRSDVTLLPDRILFITQPTNMLANTVLNPTLLNPIQVELLDINGLVVPIDGEVIDLQITNGLVPLLGVTQVTTVGGVATFDAVTIDDPGTFLTLTAIDETSGLTSAASSTFGVFTPDSFLTTHTTLSTIPNPSTYGDLVTMAATVASTVTPAAGGLVEFFDNSASLGFAATDSLGAAFLSVSSLTAGVHAITAHYLGDIGFNPSVSSFQVQTVNKAGLTVLGLTANDKVYDGTKAATLGGGVPLLIGVFNSDDVGVDTSAATAAFISKSATTGITVNISGLTLTGTSAGNYTLLPATTFAAITPRPLSAATVTIASKLFDGNTSATILTRTLQGIIAGDVAVPIGGTATFSDAAVGTNKAVSVTGMTLTGANASSYIFTPTASGHADILNSLPPAAPSGLVSAAQNSSSIRTTWNLNGTSETGVYVVRWNGTAWVTIATLGAGANSFTDTNLAANTTYIYDVVAFNSFGVTWANAYSSARTSLLVAPSVPTGVTATGLSANAARVTWTLNGGAESSVLVVRWNGTAWVTIATLGAGATSYIDTTLSPSHTYLFDVVAVNAAGQTWANTYSSATTLAAPTAAPAAATGLSTTVLSSTSVRVNWTLNGGSEKVVYVFKWNGTSFQAIAALAVGTATYTDTSAVLGANYYLIATANDFGSTFSSSYVTATVS